MIVSTLTALAANLSVVRLLLSIVQFYYSFLFVSRLFFTQKYFSLNPLPRRLALL